MCCLALRHFFVWPPTGPSVGILNCFKVFTPWNKKKTTVTKPMVSPVLEMYSLTVPTGHRLTLVKRLLVQYRSKCLEATLTHAGGLVTEEHFSF